MRAHGVAGAQVLAPIADGLLHLINIGMGPALNVTYVLTPENPQPSESEKTGYLAHILLRESATVPVAQGAIARNKWKLVLNYNSVSGRKYETVIKINNSVLASATYQAIK